MGAPRKPPGSKPPSPRDAVLAAADARMADAKRQFSQAALSCMRGAHDAPVQVREALAAIDAARAELRHLADDGAADGMQFMLRRLTDTELAAFIGRLEIALRRLVGRHADDHRIAMDAARAEEDRRRC